MTDTDPTQIVMPPYPPEEAPQAEQIPLDFQSEFPCGQCDRVFDSAAALNGHLIAHRPPVSCPECGKEYRTPGALGNHRKQLHGHVGPWAAKEAEKRAEVEAPVKPRGRPPKTRINMDWQADDIFQSVVESLWPGGAIPDWLHTSPGAMA